MHVVDLKFLYVNIVKVFERSAICLLSVEHAICIRLLAQPGIIMGASNAGFVIGNRLQSSEMIQLSHTLFLNCSRLI